MRFLFAFQNNFPGLLVCNARKWEQSRETAINFLSDGRFGPVFLCWNKNYKNYVMGGKFCWFDLPIKLHKKQRGFQGPNSPMVWIPLLRSHLLNCFRHLQGGRNMISTIFLLSSVYGTWSSARGFSVHIPTKFSGLQVCNAWKREQWRKTAINFPSDSWFRPIFLCRNENDKNYAVWGEFYWFDLLIKLHKKTKRVPVPEQSNGMDSASTVASP